MNNVGRRVVEGTRRDGTGSRRIEWRVRWGAGDEGLEGVERI